MLDCNYFGLIIPPCLFFSSLFRYLPTIFDRKMMKRVSRIEITFQILLIFFFSQNVALLRLISWISMLFQLKSLSFFKLSLHNWLKNCIYIYPLPYFSFCISRNFLNYESWLKSPTHCRPTIDTASYFYIFLPIHFFYVYNHHIYVQKACR